MKIELGKRYVMKQDFDNWKILVKAGSKVVVENFYPNGRVTLRPIGLSCNFDIHESRQLEDYLGNYVVGAGDTVNEDTVEQDILDAEQSVLAAQANAEAAGAQYRHAVTLRPAPGYERLAEVFCAAHDQAAIGKGADRHANGLPFHEQRMQAISQLLDSPDGMAYQVCKKVVEALGLPTFDRKKAELLGAINYLAGIVIFLEDREGDEEDVGDL